MADYIDREQLLELINEDYKYQNPTNEYTRGCNEACDWAIKTIKNIPAADVVPKSEVAEFETKLRQLEDKLRQYERVCGKIVIKDGVGIGLLPDGKETVYILKSIAKVTKELAIRRTKQEVAREIFEEIERFLYMNFRFCKEEIGNDDTKYFEGRLELNTQIQNFIAELKKEIHGG